MIDELHEGVLADSVPCPHCFVEPVWENEDFFWYHKHSCPLNSRNLREKQERYQKKKSAALSASRKWERKERRRERIDYWIYRWEIKDIVFTIVLVSFLIFLALFFAGVIDLE